MIDTFQASAEAVGAVVKRFVTVDEAVACALKTAGTSVAASRLPQGIAERFSSVSFETGGLLKDTRACVSFAQAGIAATGTILLDLTDQADRSATALPPVHIVFLKASSVVPDLYALGRVLDEIQTAEGNSYLSLTTGPSRTADIERVLTIGVHGPKELHILILEGE